MREGVYPAANAKAPEGAKKMRKKGIKLKVSWLVKVHLMKSRALRPIGLLRLAPLAQGIAARPALLPGLAHFEKSGHLGESIKRG